MFICIFTSFSFIGIICQWEYKPVSRYWFTVDIISVSITWKFHDLTGTKTQGVWEPWKAPIGSRAKPCWGRSCQKLLDFSKFVIFFFTNKCTLHPFPLGTAKHSWCFFCDISLRMQCFSNIKLYGIYQIVIL